MTLARRLECFMRRVDDDQPCRLDAEPATGRRGSVPPLILAHRVRPAALAGLCVMRANAARAMNPGPRPGWTLLDRRRVESAETDVRVSQWGSS